MMTTRRAKLVSIAILVAAVVLALSMTALGQCSMCRASLAGSNNAFFIRQFNLGVLVLLVPPVAMFCSIFVVLRRHGIDDRWAPDSQEDHER
jgi:hypothetical protein